MSVVSNNILAGSSGQGGATAYEIERSLRFNSADSAHLSRLPSVEGNRKTWTWSGWVKRSGIGANDNLFKVSGSGTKATSFQIEFHNGNFVSIDYGGAFYLKTNRLIRDPSAWMHLVVSVNTTLGTADNRIRLYINGTEETSFDIRNNPNQNEDLAVNTTSAHTISTGNASGLDGYLADVHFVDGQALAPTDFGETDSNGVWQAKEYTGSYGTNGFHLPFSDNSANAQLGLDYSQGNPGTNNKGMEVVTYTGNGTGQSINNLSFQPDFIWTKRRSTAGSHGFFDSVRGATKWIGSNSTSSEQVYSDSLTSFDSNGFSVGADSAWGGLNVNGTTNVAWCWKAGGTASTNTDGTVTSSVSANTSYGFSITSFTVGSTPYTVGHGLGSIPKLIIMKSRTGTTNWNVYHDSTGNQSRSYLNLTNAASSGESCWNNTSPTSAVFSMGSSGEFSGDMIAYAWSEVAGFSKISSYTGNGSSSGPSITTGFKPKFILMKRTDASGYNWVIFDAERNAFDERIYPNSSSAGATGITAYTVNSNGFTVSTSDTVWNASGGTYIYAAFADTPGNDWTVNNLVATAGLETANQGFDCRSNLTAPFTVNDLNFQPDLIIGKSTSNAEYWIVADSSDNFANGLKLNDTSAKGSGTPVTNVTATGYQSSNNWFTTGRTYTTWCWKAGGAAVSNTAGSITSSVSANTTYGFSIVKNTYSGSYGFLSVGHGLGKTPSLVISKRTDSTGSWLVHTRATGSYQMLTLNTTDAATAADSYFSADDSTFSLYHGHYTDNGHEYVHYCWSEIIGFSKFGTFTHSGSNSGVSGLGFKPRYVLIKRTDGGTDNWYLFDSSRNTNNALFPNTDGASNAGWAVTFNDSGFSWVAGSFNSGTYIYAAFADKPPGEIIDSLIDTPTNAETPTDTGVGGEVKGNYCMMNPLINPTGSTFSDGNLSVVTGSTFGTFVSTMAPSSGKWYAEMKVVSTSGYPLCGIARTDTTFASDSYLGKFSTMYGYYGINGNKYNNNTSQSYGSIYGAGDIIGIAFDADNGTLTFYKNGVSQGVAYSSIPSGHYYFAGCEFNTAVGSQTWNFGQRAFAYTAPSGFKALCSANLSDPTISDPSQYFDTKLYTGNASSNTISGLNFSPDLLWLKSRGSAQSHALFDLVRGSGQRLQSNATSAEDAYSSFFTGFTSDGFTLNQSSGINLNNDPLVAWAWDAGTSTVTNNDGSVTSQVRANPSAGFSIVAYTGTGSTATWGHGLNSAPELVIIKSRSDAQNWAVYSKHTSGAASPAEEYGFLNSTNAFSSSGAGFFWNNTLPTSSVVTVGSDNTVNGSSKTYVAYCFSPVSQYSAMGSYIGTGGSNFIFTGMAVAWVLIKKTSGADNWFIYDAVRDTTNARSAVLRPNLGNAELTSSVTLDFLSNGFSMNTSDSGINASGQTYIYYAVAENPFKTARAR